MNDLSEAHAIYWNKSLVHFASYQLHNENIVMDDWNLDEMSISKWHQSQHYKSWMPKIVYKKWQIIH